jgi:hypothetical protein
MWQQNKQENMMAKKKNDAVEHAASTFGSFLEEEGIREEVEAVAILSQCFNFPAVETAG